jgi:1-acyl-sn-glycerol-3-phosphate acyltransferase
MQTAYVLFGLLAWLAIAVLGVFALLGVLLLPTLAARRAFAGLMARAMLGAAGMRLRVHGLERLPAGACVVVANHCSYLDGPVIKAALPTRFSFVIKKEMAGVPFAGFLLRRIGSEFVDRFDRNKGAADARRLLRSANRGQSLAFFPEGTFGAQPGLMKFHAGAFTIAARSNLTVVPCVIRGTRALLPADRWFPRPGVIDVEVLEPLAVPEGTAPDPIDLRERSRAAILARLGEPDLLHAAPVTPANLV